MDCRPNRSWIVAIKKELKIFNLVEELALNTNNWEKKIHVKT